MDILVEESVVLEIKAVAKLENIHRAQGITYLRLSRLRAGLILNFNVTRMRDGIMRILNDRTDKP